MAKVKFYLKNDNNPTLIVLSYSYGKRLRMSTGLMVNPKNWNIKSQRFKELQTNKEERKINARLNQISHIVEDIHFNYKLQNINPSTLEFKKAIQRRMSGKEHQITFIEYIDKYREQKKSTVKHLTWKKMGSSVTRLKEFNPRLEFRDINLDFYYSFLKFLYQKGQSANTAGKHISFVKAVMNEALDQGLTDNTNHQNRKFIAPYADTDHVVLSSEEIEQLHQLELTNSGEAKAKDLFVMGCYTGVRFSDLSKIRKQNINTVDDTLILSMRTEKTGKQIAVPIHPNANEILEKYNYNLPKPITNQKFNEHLKTICKRAGFTDTVYLMKSIAGKLVEIESPKYTNIASHTARRSFATNAVLAGIDPILVMALTGHTSMKSFLRYIRISPEKKAVLVAKLGIFSK